MTQDSLIPSRTVMKRFADQIIVSAYLYVYSTEFHQYSVLLKYLDSNQDFQGLSLVQ